MRFSLVLFLVPTLLSAQGIPRFTLPAATARLTEEFDALSWARELRDGRVILSDPRANRVVVADLKAGTVQQIGHSGEGPGEYARAQPAWSIGGDSSIMVNAVQRWLLLDGDKIVTTITSSAPAVAALKPTVRGADTLGSVYTAGTVAGQNGPMGDSTALMRVARGTGRLDTLGRLRAVVARQTAAADKKGFFEFRMPTIQVAEEAVPFRDGWLAVTRLDPYRVDWRSPDGRWIKGAALPFVAVRMDDREKHAYVERVAKRTGRPAQPIDSIADWPETVPPWQSPNVLLAAPDGRVLIPRLASAANAEMRYDIVNRAGRIDGQLTMDANERIIGFGPRSVYVAVTDDDGIQRLQCHTWPPIAARH